MAFARAWRRAVIAVTAAVLAVAVAASSATTAQGVRSDPGYAHAFLIVVSAENDVAVLSRARVSRLFLKKVSRWDSGVPVLPVDLPATSPVRDAFSRQVLSKSVSSVKAYWQQQIFSGREVPPPEKAGDEAVLEFVRANPGAIAYVSPRASLPAGVRVVPLAD